MGGGRFAHCARNASRIVFFLTEDIAAQARRNCGRNLPMQLPQDLKQCRSLYFQTQHYHPTLSQPRSLTIYQLSGTLSYSIVVEFSSLLTTSRSIPPKPISFHPTKEKEMRYLRETVGWLPRNLHLVRLLVKVRIRPTFFDRAELNQEPKLQITRSTRRPLSMLQCLQRTFRLICFPASSSLRIPRPRMNQKRPRLPLLGRTSPVMSLTRF